MATVSRLNIRSPTALSVDSPLATPSSLRHQSSNASLLSVTSEGGRERIRTWGDQEIAQWLAENKCSAYGPVFRDNDIRGEVLLDVDESALKEMGVQSVGDRIKIKVAIKKLRQACVAASVRASQEAPVAQLAAKSAGQKSIPPPLHLNSASRLGQAYQPSPPAVVSASLTASASSSNGLTSAPAQVQAQAQHHRKGSSPRSRPGPPPAPAPGGSLPLPPTGAETSPVRTREKPIPVQPPSQHHSSSSWSQTGGYGLPRAPTDQRAQSGRFPVPAQASGTSPSKNGQVHRKAASSASTEPARPRTASSMHTTQQSLSQHPYAISSSPSPTGDAFGPASYYSSSSNRPGTAPSSVSLAPLTTATTGGLLSPIVETLSGVPSPTGAEMPRPATTGSQQGFTVGKGGFARPTTAGGTVAVNSQGIVQNPSAVPLEDLMRKTVRFTGPDESGSKMVSVEGARDAAEVLTRVLKRFKLPNTGSAVAVDTERGEKVTEIDGWAIFAVASATGARVLPDSELITICTSTNRPERQKGLMVRKVHHAPMAPSQRKLQNFFGIQAPPSPASPRHAVAPPSPSPSSDGSSYERDPPTPRSYNPLNRASMVNVMSGLADWYQPDLPPLPTQVPEVDSKRASVLEPPRKMRSFFGHRPPSELISLHLQDYFPSAEKKLLRKSIASRQSIALGSRTRPQSQYSNDGRGSWDQGMWPPSRFSMSSFSSGDSGGFLTPNAAAPPVPAKDHMAPAPLNDSRNSGDSGRLAPAINEPTFAAVNNGVAGDRRSKISTTSRSSSQRDSDSASLLTVDEITAEVEYRRASIAASEDDEQDETMSLRPKSFRRASSVAPSESDVEEEDEDEDEDDEAEEEAAVEQGGPEKVTSSGDRSQIKWIKGAVIGTGSFGVVSLGMVATTGMLMAVKQVELPTGGSANEERKRNMLTALQHEIDLLKTMEHANIVQYLDSSTDGAHLNIFLEYVPGGSIAALLRNYGAFEEALVSNFVRQILTGLNYLHERDIIHRDIKGANILVDNKGGIKISDFGISKKVEDNLLSTTRVHRPSLQGSVFWMAPEVVKQVPYTSKADIWSIGSVTLEMLTGSHPYPNLSQMQALFRIGSSKSPSPEIPADIGADAQDFLRQTFLTDHNERPSAAELLEHAFIRPASDSVAPTPTSTAFLRPT